MTGRLTAPLVLASLAVTAILASGCVFVVDQGPILCRSSFDNLKVFVYFAFS